MLENKLGITNSIELAKEEERITKIKAIELFENKILDKIEVGTYKGLAEIHKYLFEDIYEFAAKTAPILKSIINYSKEISSLSLCKNVFLTNLSKEVA